MLFCSTLYEHTGRKVSNCAGHASKYPSVTHLSPGTTNLKSIISLFVRLNLNIYKLLDELKCVQNNASKFIACVQPYLHIYNKQNLRILKTWYRIDNVNVLKW